MVSSRVAFVLNISNICFRLILLHSKKAFHNHRPRVYASSDTDRCVKSMQTLAGTSASHHRRSLKHIVSPPKISYSVVLWRMYRPRLLQSRVLALNVTWPRPERAGPVAVTSRREHSPSTSSLQMLSPASPDVGCVLPGRSSVRFRSYGATCSG